MGIALSSMNYPCLPCTLWVDRISMNTSISRLLKDLLVVGATRSLIRKRRIRFWCHAQVALSPKNICSKLYKPFFITKYGLSWRDSGSRARKLRRRW